MSFSCSCWHGARAVCKRELTGYFATPVAYVILVVFLLISGLFTFYLGNFFGRGEADLVAFFGWHPWLYLFLIPAVTMRLWAEERRHGTLELLTTLPLTPLQLVIGKFLAAWIFTALALALTFPIWITVNFLGNPDNGVIIASYIASLLMAGAYLAIGAAVSAMTQNQVIAFVVSVTIAFLFTVSGFPIVINFFAGWLPQLWIDTIASFSFLAHFNSISEGVIELRNLAYFLTLIVFWLFINMLMIERRA